MLSLTYSAEIFKELTFHAVLGQFWVIPFLVFLSVTDIAHTNRWIVWAVITLLLAYPGGKCHPPGYSARRANGFASTSNPGRLELAEL